MQFDSKHIDAARRLLSFVAEPDRETFNQFARSASFEIKTLLYTKISNLGPPLLHLDEAEVDSFCIEFLLSSFKNNSRSEIEYSRAEAAWDLAAWFKTFLREGKEDRLLKMRDELAEFWRHGDANVHEVLLTHILEHILHIDELRALFEPWSTDPELAPAYSEGVEYAKDFSREAKRCQEP